MTEFERVNSKRVDKIMDMLQVIAKSAASNKVEDQEIIDLLAPIAQAISFEQEETVPETVEAAETNNFPTGTHPIISLAHRADLEVATAALYIIAGRVENELFERRTKRDSPSK